MPSLASIEVLRWQKACIEDICQMEMGLEFGEGGAEREAGSKYSRPRARRVIDLVMN